MFIFESHIFYLRKWTTDGKQLPTTYPTGLMGADGTCDGEAAQCINVISNDHSHNESTSWGLKTKERKEQQLGTSARCGHNHPNGLFQFRLMGREQCEATRGPTGNSPCFQPCPLSGSHSAGSTWQFIVYLGPLNCFLLFWLNKAFICVCVCSCTCDSAHSAQKEMQETVIVRSLNLAVMFKDNT